MAWSANKKGADGPPAFDAIRSPITDNWDCSTFYFACQDCLTYDILVSIMIKGGGAFVRVYSFLNMAGTNYFCLCQNKKKLKLVDG